MPIKKTPDILVIRRGETFFDPRDASENNTGEIPFGNVPSLSISLEVETADHYTSRTRASEKDREWDVRKTYSGTMTVENWSDSNKSLFFSAHTEQRTQAAQTVTGEQRRVLPGRQYQLGATVANPVGIRNVTGISVAAVGSGTSPATVTDEPRGPAGPGELVVLAHAATAITAVKVGATAATAMTVASTDNWQLEAGSLRIDVDSADVPAGSNLFVTYDWDAPNAGAPYAVGKDFDVDNALGRVHIIEGGAIAAGTEVVFGYTTVAGTYSAMTSGNQTDAIGALRLISDNAGDGVNEDWYFPQVKLTPNGDFPLISEAGSTDVASMSFNVSILKPANGEAIYCDGRPVAL